MLRELHNLPKHHNCKRVRGATQMVDVDRTMVAQLVLRATAVQVADGVSDLEYLHVPMR
jgi:hypothetical protein